MEALSKLDHLDWQFWFYWIMATTLGWVTGNLFFSALPAIIAGGFIAAFQWAVLYKRFNHTWKWFLLTFGGWLTGNILSVVFLPSILAGPMMGLTTGIAQWFFLKSKVGFSSWWIAASVIGWTTGLTLLPGIFTSGTLPGAITGFVLMLMFEWAPLDPKKARVLEHK